jgi:pantetheine-phosphate adenylyltransferase
MYQFKKLVIGGTFDHLHKGHEAFLQKAFSLGENVIIGLTSDSYITHKEHSNELFPYERRYTELSTYLKRNGLLSRAKIYPISDAFGPAISDFSINAILVTLETIKNARKINTLRKKNLFPPLKIIVMNYILGTDRRRINSTRIRKGEEDRFGRVYFSKTINFGGRSLPDTLRTTLHQPFGKLYSGVDALLKIKDSFLGDKSIVITVGDVVTYDVLNQAIIPIIAIVDLKIGRKKTYSSTSFFNFPKTVVKKRIINKSGTISRSLFFTIAKVFRELIKQKGNYVLEVIGQEDLATLPVILLAPLGSIVLYGQPGKGIVVVTVTEEAKNKVFSILSHFVK